MRKLLLAVVVLVIIAAVLAVLRVGPAPTIAIEPKAQVIGQRTPITIRVAEGKRGLSNIKVELAQGEFVRTLAEKQHAPAPVWAPWRHGTTSAELKVDAGK